MVEVPECCHGQKLLSAQVTRKRPNESADPLELLLELVTDQITLMTDVATHTAQIDEVQADYRKRRRVIIGLCRKFDFDNPNTFDDLWEWYAYWREEDLDTYQSRRTYVRELFKPLLSAINSHGEVELGADLAGIDLVGWEKVELQVRQLRVRLAKCESSEDAQAVGLLCRDIMISLGQAAYDAELHGAVDSGSAADQLKAVINHHARGGSNETLRRMAKSTVDFANTVQHRRGGNVDEAGIVAEGTVACVRLIRRLTAL